MSTCGAFDVRHGCPHHITRPTIQTSTVTTTAAINTAQADAVVPALLEAVAGIPGHMADAGEEVEEQRRRPAEQQQHADRRAEEPLHRGKGVIRHGGRDQPPGQQQRADAEPDPVTRWLIDRPMLIGQR